MPRPDEPRLFVCEGCGKTLVTTVADAFDQGWDPPEFFLGHCTCPDCLISTTLWWKLAVLQEQPTGWEAALIVSYNHRYTEYQGGNTFPPHNMPGGRDDQSPEPGEPAPADGDGDQQGEGDPVSS